MTKQKIEFPKYKYGFISDIESETFHKGLNEETVKALSKKKNDPQYIFDFRIRSYNKWKKMKEPVWANLKYPKIDFQNISYFSEPKSVTKVSSLKEIDPEIKKTMDRLGIPVDDQKRLMNVAVDVVFDSVSLGVTFQKKLIEAGVILCSISEATKKYPKLVQKYLGSVVPFDDNFYATLNSAVFSDGSFVYVPKGVKCPIELSTYFRINEKNTGQFERTLIIADEGSSVSYLEGCTAPSYDKNQLHAAVVELVALEDAEIKYSTVQNWYPGDRDTGEGGIFNFVTKRGVCKGKRSRITWTQIEVGAAITWKYPGTILEGDGSSSEFYSVALTNGFMQADTGTRMIHLGNNTRSTIIAKGISADNSHNSFRSLVYVDSNAKNVRNFSQCDSMLVGGNCSANTFPRIEAGSNVTQLEHEASTSRLNEDQLLYLQSRGFSKEDSMNMIVNGFCKDVIRKLPFEFAIESQKLLTLKLENSVG